MCTSWFVIVWNRTAQKTWGFSGYLCGCSTLFKKVNFGSGNLGWIVGRRRVQTNPLNCHLTGTSRQTYGWWKKSCTGWWYSVICRVWYIPPAAGFLPINRIIVSNFPSLHRHCIYNIVGSTQIMFRNAWYQNTWMGAEACNRKIIMLNYKANITLAIN